MRCSTSWEYRVPDRGDKDRARNSGPVLAAFLRSASVAMPARGRARRLRVEAFAFEVVVPYEILSDVYAEV
jgi:hypothetical protein